jgi:hypothetical protein
VTIGEAADAAQLRRRASAWLDIRSAPVVATVALLAVGLAYSFLWRKVIHGTGIEPIEGADMASFTRISLNILHGHFSQIYYQHSSLTSPPALEFLLVPMAGLTQLLGFAHNLADHKVAASAWFLMGPVALLIASTALFAIDAYARHWSLSEAKRLALAVVVAGAIGSVVIFWGHPEVPVSLALALWAALALERDGERALGRAGWLLGLAVAFQPLALLCLTPIVARYHWRTWINLSYRIVLPSAILLAVPFIASPHAVLFVQLHQPFTWHSISFTPWTHWAPNLAPGIKGGGPTRLFALVLGFGLGFVVCRKRYDLVTIVSMIAIAFYIRLLFESELNWYYFWPVAALCLLLAVYRSWTNFAVCTMALGASLGLGNRLVHHIIIWWPAIMLTGLVMLISGVPRTTFHRVRADSGDPSGAGSVESQADEEDRTAKVDEGAHE